VKLNNFILLKSEVKSEGQNILHQERAAYFRHEEGPWCLTSTYKLDDLYQSISESVQVSGSNPCKWRVRATLTAALGIVRFIAAQKKHPTIGRFRFSGINMRL